MDTLRLSEGELNDTVGVLFLGAVFSSMIYGLTCLQTFSYFRSSRAKTDGRWLRSLVVLLFVLDSLHQAMVLHLVYSYIVLNFQDPSKLFTSVVWSGPFEIGLNGVLGLMFNWFLAYRLWRLSANMYLVAVSIVLSIASFGTIISFGIRSTHFESITEASVGLKTHGVAVLALFFVSDSVVSASLCYYLYSSRTGVRRSNDIITKLIALTVTTGALCAVCNLTDMIIYLIAPDKIYDLFFTFIMSKLYSNALLTTLNMRRYIRELTENTPSEGIIITRDDSTRSSIRFATQDSERGQPITMVRMDGVAAHSKEGSSQLSSEYPREGKVSRIMLEEV